jgi:5-methylcytosine-specific restriction endonuclease McrA
MQEFARKFYKSQAWKKTRAFIWSRDRGLCVDCLRRGLYTPAEEVHHVEPLTPDNINDPDVSLNPTNLVSLCRECHKERHEKIEGRNRRYSLDELGRVAPRVRK